MFAIRTVLITTLVLAGRATAATSSPSEAAATLAALPAWFEPNGGQAPSHVQFVSRGANGTLLVDPSGATFQTRRSKLRVRFPGSVTAQSVFGSELRTARSSYWIGNDSSKWRRNVPQFGAVRSKQIYPGIDVAYHLSGNELEFDFLVAPHADAAAIRLAFEGAGKPRLEATGDLLFASGVRQKRPVAYQELPSGRRIVDAAYRISRAGDVHFQLGSYDPALPLVIDPVLQANYVGGDRSEKATAIAIERNGRVYITGSSSSTFSVAGQNPGIQESPKGGKDAFVARLSRNASGVLALDYWTALGGASDDEAKAITTDDRGFVFIAGETASDNFLRAGTALQDGFGGGGADAFVAVVRPSDPGGDALWYSQYYGGAAFDSANAIAVDNASSIYIAGYTTSDTLRGTSGNLQQNNRGGYEGFVARVDFSGSGGLSYATYFGGKSTDSIKAIAVDASRIVYITGYTASDDFPVTGDAPQTSLRSMFVARMNFARPGLDGLEYATYLGGSALDTPQAMILDGNNLWISGYTFSTDFPVTGNALRNVIAGSADVFLMRFDLTRRTTPDAIAYSTYLGGRDGDVVMGMALGQRGTIALAGYTYSDDFPTADSGSSASTTHGAFVALVDPAAAPAAQLVFATVSNGSLLDAATGVVVDAAGNLIVSGFTYSTNFPVTDSSRKISPGGSPQSFVMVASPAR